MTWSGVYDADVVVIGGGPAGLAAAVTAAEAGSSTLLIDENPALGGQIWRRDVQRRYPPAAARWLTRLARTRARTEQGVTVIDAWREADGVRLGAVRDGAGWEIRSPSVILCTGARERFLPFPGWTLPGVIGAGGAQALIKSGMEVRGRTAVVAGSGPLLLAVAAGIARAGGRVTLVAEQASSRSVARYASTLWRAPFLLAHAAAYRWAIGGARYETGHWVTRAEGGAAVERVVATDGRRESVHECDLLCTGYGLVPETRLARMLGCDVAGAAVQVDAQQQTSVAGIYAAGEPTGIGGVDAAIAEGIVAGLSSGGRTAEAASMARRVVAGRSMAARLAAAFTLRPELRTLASDDTVICRCEDVRLRDVDLRMGARNARLHRRIGMGACQGRVCGDALGWLGGWDAELPRPPLTPVPLGALDPAPEPLDTTD